MERHRPIIGITTDNDPDAPAPGRYRLSRTYPRAVAEAGGVPVMLAQQPDAAADYLQWCDALILTGGRDPNMQAFDQPTHPEAQLMHPDRQTFELALLDALADRPEKPVLGICLGMQMMALHADGRLNQHLADTLGEQAAAAHQRDRAHAIELQAHSSALLGDPPEADAEALGSVTSSHHQAVADPGALRTIATAPDGTIEAIDAPPEQRRFYLGVQWHPERGPDEARGPLNQPLIERFVAAARATTSVRSR